MIDYNRVDFSDVDLGIISVLYRDSLFKKVIDKSFGLFASTFTHVSDCRW